VQSRPARNLERLVFEASGWLVAGNASAVKIQCPKIRLGRWVPILNCAPVISVNAHAFFIEIRKGEISHGHARGCLAQVFWCVYVVAIGV
jgi:hypothetical protein